MRLCLALALTALCLSLADAHRFGGFGGPGGRMSSFGRGFYKFLRSHWTFHQLKCAVKDSEGEDVMSFPWYARLFECEEGTSCEVGPLEVSKWGEKYNVTFCNSVDEDGNLMVLRGACLITYTDDDSVAVDDTNGYDFCTGGPLDVEYNGRPAEAFYPEFDSFGCGSGGRRWKKTNMSTTTTTTSAPEVEGEAGEGAEEGQAGGEEEKPEVPAGPEGNVPE
ncbi:hypothetical protein CAPTEDRAFT_227442 [Capitella teleta]|uniref:Uncharacterized protein n=1 Tax=Capitella teleta TaxID=283909 RepID=R7U352_CAPTE|nr:hypothetical protein CAPTEDRAFT_227442 [Capitella teleta]|eukprot:ELU00526.1 hypothetical protein CAPTEDRAFT_227442 [Capitella teleta]